MKKTISTLVFLVVAFSGFTQSKIDTTYKDTVKQEVVHSPAQLPTYYAVLKGEQINYFYNLIKEADEKPSVLKVALDNFLSIWQVIPPQTSGVSKDTTKVNIKPKK